MNKLYKNMTSVLACCAAMACSFGSLSAEGDPHYQFSPGPMERAHEFQCNSEWSSGGEMNTDLFCIRKTGPAHVCRGDEVTIDISVTAKKDVKQVIVTDSFAPGITYVRSEPEAQAHNNHFQWFIDEMKAGETRHMSVTVMANQVGHLCDCLTVVPICRLCRSTYVGDCDLHITKTGPDCLCLGQTGCYTITVCNKGDSVARDVVLTDFVPAGLSHASGQDTASFEIGDLQPGCSKTFNVKLRAEEIGTHCNIAKVSGSNSPEKSAQACTEVFFADIELNKFGPADAYTCKTATYTITAMNKGNAELENVVIRDNVDAGTHIVDAGNGEVCDGSATWNIGTLMPGESRSVNITLRADCLGEFTNKASVTGCNDCCGPVSDCAEASTCWKGLPGLLLEMVDSCDPVCLGDSTKYSIRVMNQGTASDHNVKLMVNIPAEMTLMDTEISGATISGNMITFDTISELAPGESRSYCFTVKGTNAGDARVKVQMSSDALKTPVTEEESTTVY